MNLRLFVTKLRQAQHYNPVVMRSVVNQLQAPSSSAVARMINLSLWGLFHCVRIIRTRKLPFKKTVTRKRCGLYISNQYPMEISTWCFISQNIGQPYINHRRAIVATMQKISSHAESRAVFSAGL